MRQFWFICAFLTVTGISSATDAQTHPFSVHDILAMDRISEPAVSPNGRLIAFTVRQTDLDANRGRTDIWLISTEGTNLCQLTTNPGNDSGPMWGHESKYVYFISDRSGSSQVWKIAVEGGEARQVTNQPLDVGNLIVSPDGKYVLFSMDVFIGSSPKETKAKLDEKKTGKASGRIYEQLFIRHWDTWSDGRRSHLFVMPTTGTDNAVDVMAGIDADSPTKPFGGIEEIAFTPDGKGLIFTARTAGSDQAWSTNLDLYYAPLDGSKPPGCITKNNPASDTRPVFSPDGKNLAYLAMNAAGYEADRYRIMVMPWPKGPTRVIAESWDRSVDSYCWGTESKRIFAIAENIGQKSLFSIEIENGKVHKLVEQGYAGSPIAAGNWIYYTLNHLRSPDEICAVRPDGLTTRKVTDINAGKLAAVRMGETEQFSFPGWNDETVYCYVVKPADFDPEKKYPVAFLIHGGPQGSFGNNFHYRWNPQVYAGAGFAAVMVDFHGSTGYGQAFTDSIRGDWGGKPLEDLKKGLQATLQRSPWMDGQRVAALGASYGGYMINWIAGNWPDGFKCLVNHDGNLDERLGYYDTEELWFPEWEHQGTPWDNPEGYEKHNPINFVKNWKTPMLVIHGGQDFRVVETQGLSTFTALQRRGIPSKLLYFPDENHWVQKPHNSILWHQTVLDWLNQWTKDQPNPK